MEIKLQGYDVHADSPTGHIHFQVLQAVEKSLDDAKKIADTYLKAAKGAVLTGINKTASTQGVQPDQEKDLEKNGYFIYKIFGCPK